MNSNQEISECIKIASTLDNLGYFKLADSLTNISYRLAEEEEADKQVISSEDIDDVLIKLKEKAIEAKSLILSNLSSESLTPDKDKNLLLKIEEDGNLTFFKRINSENIFHTTYNKSNYNLYSLINNIISTKEKVELISYAKQISEIYFKSSSSLLVENSKVVKILNQLSEISWILSAFVKNFLENNPEDSINHQQEENKSQTYTQAIRNLKKENQSLETIQIDKKALNKSILDIKLLCLEINYEIEQNSETQKDIKLFMLTKNIATNKLTYPQYLTNFLSLYNYLNQNQINLNDPDISNKIQQLKDILIIPKYIYTKLQNEMKNNPT